jgi:hypothetical protein
MLELLGSKKRAGKYESATEGTTGYEKDAQFKLTPDYEAKSYIITERRIKFAEQGSLSRVNRSRPI